MNLTAAVLRVLAAKGLTAYDIADLAEAMAGDLVAPLPPPPLLEEIADKITARYGFSLHDLKGPHRHQHLAWARQHFMADAKDAGYSLPSIGRFLNRDHTTVLHGVRAHKKRFGPRAVAA